MSDDKEFPVIPLHTFPKPGMGVDGRTAGIVGAKHLYRWLSVVGNALSKEMNSFLEDVYEYTVIEAERMLEGNRVKPPSEKTESNPGEKTLIETGAYFEALGVYRTQAGVRYVGVPETGSHPTYRIPWTKLYTWTTYGTAKLPPRPHLEQAFKRIFHRRIRWLKGTPGIKIQRSKK